MAITGTERPDSPQISKPTTKNRVVRRRITYGRYENWESEMPAQGALDPSRGYFRNYQPNPRGPYVDVTLIYDSEGTVINFQPCDGDEQFFANSSGREVPLEKRNNYRTKWNHFLYYRNNGIAKTVNDFPGGQAGYDAATDLADLNGNKDLLWSKQLLASPALVKIKDPEKPGTQAYLAGAVTVTRRSWYRQQIDAEGDLTEVVRRVIPAETFSAMPSGIDNWLVLSADTQHDGRYWVTTVVFVHSEEGWDNDLYEVP